MSRSILVAAIASLLLAATLAAQTRSPQLVNEVKAVCTAEAQQKAVRGTVTLLAEIDSEGVPVKVEPVTGWHRGTFHPTLGHGLEEAAAEAVAQWRFAPSGTDLPVGTIQLDVGFRCTKPVKAVFPKPE